MPTVLSEPTKPVEHESDDLRFRLTRRLVEMLREKGVLTGHYELLDGELIDRYGMRMPLSRRQVDVLEKQGELVGRYELINGVLISKMGQNSPHSFTLRLIAKWLTLLFGIDFVQSQLPIEVENADRELNYPEPDVAVLTTNWKAFNKRDPSPHEVALAVEISDTTLKTDRTDKAELYARAGIVEYWIVDVKGRAIYVHRKPENGQYIEITRYAENMRVSCLAKPDADVLVSELIIPVKSGEGAE